MERFSELNIHGRHPKDLPDKETINDILLELQDTRKFDIDLINLQSTKVDGGKWYANNKVFHEWVEQGEVRICEMDYSSMNFNLDPETPSYLSVKETLYGIIRYPMRLSVKFKAGILSLNKGAEEICEASNEVYLRLKDYLGPDVIQDQFMIMDFTIDFIVSRCKVL